jgi:hypothetical protein
MSCLSFLKESSLRSTLILTAISFGWTTTAAAATPTWTTLASSANPSATGATVTFTATVKVVGGGGPPTGSVTFKDAATTLGTIPLSASGTAAFTTLALARGTHEIVAVYSGDASYSTSTSPAVSQAVPDKVGCSVANFFATPSPITMTATPRALLSADFNLDGKPDLAVGTATSVRVYLGDGAAGFTLSADVAAPANSMSVRDFNLDGKPDIVVAQSSVNLLLGDGAGGFTLSSSSPIATGNAVTTGDVNLDGKPDISIANGPAHNVATLLGDGAGGFAQAPGSPVTMQSTQMGPSDPVTLAMGDFNGDGRPDVAVGNSSFNPSINQRYDTLTILMGDGTGAFNDSLSSTRSLFRFPIAMEIADVNGDGKQDLVVANYVFQFVGASPVLALLGNGDGTFAYNAAFEGGTDYPYALAIKDFNGDAKLDLALSYQNESTNNLAVLPGGGNGKFGLAAGSFMTIGGYRYGIAAADFNLDGTPDLAAVSSEAKIVTTLLNNCAAPATSTTLTSSPSPSSSGQSITLTATVAPASGSAVPTGQVKFFEFRDERDFLVGEAVTLVNGVATLSRSPTDGAHTYSARYTGSATFGGSVSGSVTHTVNPRVTINDPSANSATQTSVAVVVNLSNTSNVTVTMDYATADHSARAGVDYTQASGTLTFSPGQFTKTIIVPLLPGSPGPNKDFFITLSNLTNATFTKSNAIVTITYAAPGALTLSIDDPSLKEGNTGTTLLAFSVNLSKVNFTAVTIDYTTANGTAIAGTDYTAKSGTVTFAPGKRSRAILIPLAGDTTVNGNRTLVVNLTNVTGGPQVTKSQGTGTIVDDDPPTAASTVSQLRLYSNATFEHLYTTDTNEYAVLATRGWNQEGTAYTMFQDAGLRGTAYGVPIYRLYHAGIQQHHWTTDWYETTVLAAGDWDYEGIPGYVLPTQETGTIPLYRLSLASPPLHLWTTDANEKLVLSTQRGWVYEGILGYVIP